MANQIKDIESAYIKQNLPSIKIGDLIKIGVLIKEGNKERIQYSEGIVIAKHNAGLNTTITIRRTLQGIGVERIYLIHSPKITSIKILKHFKTRRAKIFYIRNTKTKKLKEQIQ
uniref:ribosomal protein L19 n=1 Tax=Galdieria phlegrea TaxID=1389228 RepID=UPI0023D87F9A|nr:ribosomal protein L19 [Galdieria phlegrea]UNJ16256.1 ribosomal protein L19 [Galdieria sp.]WDA99692.1 ribosomal protein L19 [Galdieria sulphuraria]WDA99884.1 ribosomal protein L19 [Galdieria phlegrea]